MDELKILTVFNLVLLILILYSGVTKKVNLPIHLSVFMLYNLVFYISFFTNGQGGQGFAWVFLNSICSLLQFIILIMVLSFKFFKNRKLPQDNSKKL